MTDVRLTAINPEDSTVVPVACNAQGELLVEGEKELVTHFPDGLTVGSGEISPTITLEADGSIKGYIPTLSITEHLIELRSNVDSENSIRFSVDAEGGGEFARGVKCTGGFVVYPGNDGVYSFASRNAANAYWSAYVTATGTAFFYGDVVIGSRNKRWMIIESNGLAHLVEQSRFTEEGLTSLDPAAAAAEAPSYPELRDIPGELTMVQRQLQKVMERLKMAPEAGWEVWDGSD